MDPRFPSPFIPAPAKIRYKRSSSILKQNHDLAVAESFFTLTIDKKKQASFPSNNISFNKFSVILK